MMDEKDNTGGSKRHYEDQPEIYANAVRAGKRTYFFDVRATRAGEHYLTMTESKRRYDDEGNFTYQKHKIFLYKEDFEKFTDALTDAIKKIIELNTERDSNMAEKVENSFSDVNFEDLGSGDKAEASTKTSEPATEEAPAEAATEETPTEESTEETPAEDSSDAKEDAPVEDTTEATAENTDTETKEELSFDEMTSADLMDDTPATEEKKEE